MATKNIFNIPVDGRTSQEYFNHISGLDISFNGERQVEADLQGTVKVDGTIAGYEPVGTEEIV